MFADLDLSKPLIYPKGVAFVGPAGSMAGNKVYQVDDFNNDTYPEIAILRLDTKGYIVSGGAGGIKANITLSSMTGNQGISLTFSSYIGGVQNLGDQNLDKINDFAISECTSGKKGRVSVIFGSNSPVNLDLSSPIDSTKGYYIDGPSNVITSNIIPPVVIKLGDINGDGIPDFVITFPWHNNFLGRMCIFYGGNTQNIDLTQVLPANKGFCVDGYDASGIFGASIVNIDDQNGDGINDFAVGAYGAKKVYVYISNINLTNYFSSSYTYVISGPGSSFFAYSLAKMNDFDGNGVSDLAIGAYFANSVYLVKNINSNITITASSYPSNVYKIQGPSSSSFGWSVVGDLDLNGNGKTDLAIGAYTNSDLASNAGKVFVVFDPTSTDLDLSGAVLPGNVRVISTSKANRECWESALFSLKFVA